MTLEQRITELITRIGTEIKSLRAADGNLASLSTTAKSSLVAAINELEAATSSSLIDDNANNSVNTFSSSKILNLVSQAKSEIIGGADNLHDTLKEISDLADSTAGSLTTAIGNRVRFDAAQSLTEPQKAQARANIGALSTAEIGNPDTDFVAQFNAALI